MQLVIAVKSHYKPQHFPSHFILQSIIICLLQYPWSTNLLSGSKSIQRDTSWGLILLTWMLVRNGVCQLRSVVKLVQEELRLNECNTATHTHYTCSQTALLQLLSHCHTGRTELKTQSWGMAAPLQLFFWGFCLLSLINLMMKLNAVQCGQIKLKSALSAVQTILQ